MPTAIEFIADRLPRVTVEDVRRFADTVEIRDARGFAAVGFARRLGSEAQAPLTQNPRQGA